MSAAAAMTSDELELKFRVPAPSIGPLREAMRLHGAVAVPMHATYFDTADGRLAAHRVALRLRQEGDRRVQTLKAEGASAVQRLEHEVVLGPQDATAQPDPQHHRGHAAHAALLQALGEASASSLLPRLQTEVMRWRLEVDNEGTRIELALDLGEIRAAGRRVAVAELEMERLHGPAAGLFALARQWVPHGGLWLSTVSKALMGQRLLDPAAAVPLRAAVPQLPVQPDGPTLLRAALHATLSQVLANASEVAEGRDEAEFVHQLRVGLRRLRAVLRELKGLSPEIDPAWEPRLAETFAALGALRDDRAVAEAVQPLLQQAGAPLDHWTPAPAPDAAALVRAPGFQATLLQVLALSHAPAPELSPLDAASARRCVAARLDRLHAQVARAARRFEQRPMAAQHRARKRLKRLRYLAELVQPLWASKPAPRYLLRLARAQEALGHHGDVATAAAKFRDEAVRDPRAWYAAGFLQAHLVVTGRAAGKALRGLRRGKPFWHA